MAYIWVTLLLPILTLLATGWAQDTGRITENIIPDIKRVGEVGRLNCTVTGQKRNKVRWIHQRNNLVISSDDTIDLEPVFNPIIDGNYKYMVEKDILGDRTVYTLIIRRLESTDAGIYVCQLDLKGENVNPFKEGHLIVMSPPTIIQSRTTQTVTVATGDNVTLTCSASGYPIPRIKWVRGNGINIPQPYNQFAVAGDVLQLTQVKRQDRGVYRCIADNDVRPPATYDATLYVNFQPFARPVQTTYGQASNRRLDIVMECRISGLPDPDMRWYKKLGADARREIKDDDEHDIHVLISHSAQELTISEFWLQLKIINVQAKDFGEYICEGQNQLGVGSTIVRLHETSECQGPDCPAENVGPSGSAPSSVTLSTLLVFLISALFALIVLH